MPNAKKQRGKKKKAGAGAGAAAPKRPPATAAAASRIEAANAVLDLSTGLEPFLSIDLPAAPVAAASTAAAAAADPVHLEIRSPNTVRDGDAQGMYDLLKGNMHDMYVEAGWGWNKAEKWREMEHRDARFLIARCGGGDGGGGDGTVGERGKEAGGVASATAGVGGVRLSEEKGVDGAAVPSSTVGGGDGGKGAGEAEPDAAERKPSAGGEERLAGYCHFRFAWDQDENEDGEGVGGTEDVLYVYELQVAPWAKRRGLGRRMMQALEVCAQFSPPLYGCPLLQARSRARSGLPLLHVGCRLRSCCGLRCQDLLPAGCVALASECAANYVVNLPRISHPLQQQHTIEQDECHRGGGSAVSGTLKPKHCPAPHARLHSWL